MVKGEARRGRTPAWPLTYAVVEGLEGKGGLAAQKQISTKDLAAYVIKRVDEVAKAQQQEQEPHYFKGRDA